MTGPHSQYRRYRSGGARLAVCEEQANLSNEVAWFQRECLLSSSLAGSARGRREGFIAARGFLWRTPRQERRDLLEETQMKALRICNRVDQSNAHERNDPIQDSSTQQRTRSRTILRYCASLPAFQACLDCCTLLKLALQGCACQAHPEPLMAAFHNEHPPIPSLSLARLPLAPPSRPFPLLPLALFTLPQRSFLHLILLLLSGPAFIPPNSSTPRARQYRRSLSEKSPQADCIKTPACLLLIRSTVCVYSTSIFIFAAYRVCQKCAPSCCDACSSQIHQDVAPPSSATPPGHCD
jgi:hypothetical protein